MIDDTKKEVTDAGESPETATGEGNPASLSINDLANIKQIIDVASTRGAFKANEFQVVGATYDRLSAFLVSVMPAPEEAPAEEDVTDEDASEETEA